MKPLLVTFGSLGIFIGDHIMFDDASTNLQKSICCFGNRRIFRGAKSESYHVKSIQIYSDSSVIQMKMN